MNKPVYLGFSILELSKMRDKIVLYGYRQLYCIHKNR